HGEDREWEDDAPRGGLRAPRGRVGADPGRRPGRDAPPAGRPRDRLRAPGPGALLDDDGAGAPGLRAVAPEVGGAGERGAGRGADPMKVTVRYLAQAKEAAGRASEEVELDGPTTLQDLIVRLARRHGAAFERMALNGADTPHPSLLIVVGDEQVRSGEPRRLA